MLTNPPSTILVVDDNPATLYSTSRVLRGAGWNVLEANTGMKGLSLAAEGVDLVVLDVNLPDIDGFEVCRRIRALPIAARTPVVHLSATFVQDSDKVQGLQVGADGYLTHPVEPPVLIATVHAFLRTRQAERELRESEAKFRAVFDNAINGIALMSEAFVYTEINPAMATIVDGPPDVLLNKCIFDLVPPDRHDEVNRMIKEVKEHDHWRGTLPAITATSRLIQLEWSVSRHNVPGFWLAVVSDITERLKMEAERAKLLVSERAARTEAERANRLKDEFLATLSHELRTPLNAILGWSQLLKLKTLDPAEIDNGIETIERSARAQAQLIADLLDVSRITSGKLRLDVQVVDPLETIEAALRTIATAATAKGIKLTKILSSDAGPISGDPSRLQQVVWNLVNNAVKFTPKGGQIQVTLERVNSTIEIAVSDDGQGISAELLPFIFERFKQGDVATTRNHGGLGLGLAIAKQLVEMHGGTIRAESSGQGKGATFTVALPLSSVQARKQPVEVNGQSAIEAKTNGVRLDGVRVLVVDDDADARYLTKRILTDAGAESINAGSAAEAMESVKSFKPHVLVSDLGMPKQDGYELIRQLRSSGYTYKDLPAVALTAFARTDDRRRALLAGFQLHLAKPVDPSELLAVVASLVGRTDAN